MQNVRFNHSGEVAVLSGNSKQRRKARKELQSTGRFTEISNSKLATEKAWIKKDEKYNKSFLSGISGLISNR